MPLPSGLGLICKENYLVMKHIIYSLILSFFIISCDKKETSKTEETLTAPTPEKGEALFTANNCIACHKVDQKIIGPSLQETAKIYKEKNGDMIAFLKEEAEEGFLVLENFQETIKRAAMVQERGMSTNQLLKDCIDMIPILTNSIKYNL